MTERSCCAAQICVPCGFSSAGRSGQVLVKLWFSVVWHQAVNISDGERFFTAGRRGWRNWLPAPGRDQIPWSKELILGDLRQQNPALPLTLSGLRSIALPSCVLESLQGDAWPFERSRQKGGAGDVAHGILKTKPPGRIAARDRGRQNPCR